MALTQTALMALFLQCAPQVAPETLSTLVAVESSGNPFAIAVVGDKKIPPPKSLNEAITAAKKLEAEGENYSVGLMQVNKKNFSKLGLSIDNAFEPCANISAGAKIIEQCFMSAKNNKAFNSEQTALRGALSCYYSGNFTRGFEKEESVGNSYVERANNVVVAKYRVPKIEPEEVQEKEITTDKKDYVVAQDEVSNGLDIQRQPESNRKAWDVYGDY